MKRWLQLIWTQLWLTGVVCLVMLALYTSLGRQLIPLVETLELDVEQLLSEQLGVPVEIGSLKGDWLWFSPRIQANDIQLGETGKGLKIQRLEAKLDVSASLFYRVPVFDKINIAGVQLPFSQNENNNWYLSQLALSSNDNRSLSKEFWLGDKPLWLELLGQQGEIHLYNWQVVVQAYNRPAKSINILDLRLRNKGQQHWLDGEVQLGDSGAVLRTQFEVEGDLWDFSDHQGKGYLELANQSLQGWIPDFSNAWQIEKVSAGAKLWVEVEAGRLHSLDGYIDVPEFLLVKTIDAKRHDISFEDARITLAGRRDNSDWHLWFDTEANRLSATLPPKPKGRISWLPSIEGGIQLAFSEIDLAQTAAWVDEFKLLSEEYMDYITHFQPKGLVEQLRVNMIPERDMLWGVSLDLVAASIQGWNGVPAIDDLTATLDFNAEKGRMKTAAINPLLHFSNLYQDGWPLTDFDSEVFWQIEPDYLRLAAPALTAKYQQAELNGSFSLYVPLGDSLIEPQLNLLLGIQHLELVEQKAFVPPGAAIEVSAWLNENLAAGQAKQASFLFSSSLENEPAVNSQTVQLYSDIQNADLTYLPDWPEITQLKASLMVDVPDVDVWVHKATTLGGELVPSSTRIKVRTDKDNTSWLTLRGTLAGNASEGIKYFHQTPLQQQVSGALDTWRVEGPVVSELYAQIPLSDRDKDLKIRLSSQLKGNDVDITDLGLSFEHIKGVVEFDSEIGLTAKGLQAAIFSGAVSADIQSVRADTGFDIFIKARGHAQSELIKQWQPLFIFKPISGELDYTLDLQVRPLERGGLVLNIDSDLAGIEVATPLPFAKSPLQILPFHLSVKKARDLRIDFRYGDLANGVVALEEGELKRGQIYLGATPSYLPSDDGLSIVGNIATELDAKAWWDLWRSIKPTIGVETQIKEKAAVLTHINFSAAEVNAWHQMMGASHIIGNYQWNQWQLELDSELMKGEIILPDDLVNNVIALDLEYIHMPIKDNDPNKGIKFGAAETVDPLQSFNPKWIPNIDLKVAEVFFGTSNYGRWDMTMRQQEEFTQIHIKDSDVKSLTMKGDINWRKGEDGHKTHLSLFRISSKNLGDSQRAFRKAASIEAENSKFDVDLTWQGSPARFNYASLSGLAKVSIKDGVLVSDNAGALKAFGVLNFNSISRSLQLDFSDLYEEGVAFDYLKTRLSFENGIATFVDPLLIDGPGAKFQSNGTIDFNTETIDQKLVVTFPITSSLPLVAVLAGLAPQIAGAIYVTEKLIGEELEQFTSASYTVSGTIEDPKMTIDKAFDNELEGKESRSFKDRFLDIFGLGDDD
ncbi:MAG: TIGR02099 family protein [Oleispira sp.]|nr:TIGR02099 family protein [Oleispira sp.]